MRLRTLLRLEVLAPATLGAVLAADLGLRLLPMDRFAFRAWEAVRVPGGESPFRPHHRYHNPRAYGDLANLSNLPALREYRAETVTIDALGYRNPPRLAASGRVRALLVGSSFSAGTEVGDHETLAARLGVLTGLPVYNAGVGETDFVTIRALARRLGLTRGVVIFEYLDSREGPPLALGAGVRRARRCPRALAERGARACGVANALVERARVSPLHILSHRWLRSLQDDRWLPNLDAPRVARAGLRNGREMLFLAGDATWSHEPSWEDQAARYFRWLAAKVRGEGLGLLVVLAPRKYTVYAPLLARPDYAHAAAGTLERLVARLRGVGIPVVDLTGVFRPAAAEGLDRGRYIYFLDDTHWNAAGIALAAEAIAPHLRALAAPGAGAPAR